MRGTAATLRHAAAGLESASRTVSLFLGLIVLGLFAAVAWTSLEAGDVMRWAHEVFGLTFLIALAALAVTALHAWLCLEVDGRVHPARLETGLQAANGIATLALTYTLLGISLGIGSLAGHELGPETIQAVIRDLTRHFSMAFLTTVVGLPVSAALRAVIAIRARRIEARAPAPNPTLVTGEIS